MRTEEGWTSVDLVASTTSRFYAAVALGIWCANWELAVDAHGINESRAT